jgi:hypothetical protein
METENRDSEQKKILIVVPHADTESLCNTTRANHWLEHHWKEWLCFEHTQNNPITVVQIISSNLRVLE